MKMSEALLLMATPIITDLNDPMEKLFRETSDEAYLMMTRFITSDEAIDEVLPNLDYLDTEEAKREALFDAYIVYLEDTLPEGINDTNYQHNN